MVIFNLIFGIFYLMAIEANAANVLIWDAGDNKSVGHVALQTRTYHISLWPETRKSMFEDEYPRLFQSFIGGEKGVIHFHHEYDYLCEDHKEPSQYLLESISSRRIDELYEEILEYNNVTPDTVTLEAGAEKFRRTGKAEITLSKTKWALRTEGTGRDFYKKAQSCVTCTANIVNIAGDGVLEPFIGNKNIYRTSNILTRLSRTLDLTKEHINEIPFNVFISVAEFKHCINSLYNEILTSRSTLPKSIASLSPVKIISRNSYIISPIDASAHYYVDGSFSYRAEEKDNFLFRLIPEASNTFRISSVDTLDVNTTTNRVLNVRHAFSWGDRSVYMAHDDLRWKNHRSFIIEGYRGYHRFINVERGAVLGVSDEGTLKAFSPGNDDFSDNKLFRITR